MEGMDDLEDFMGGKINNYPKPLLINIYSS